MFSGHGGLDSVRASNASQTSCGLNESNGPFGDVSSDWPIGRLNETRFIPLAGQINSKNMTSGGILMDAK